jgi:hypothetical protein
MKKFAMIAVALGLTACASTSNREIEGLKAQVADLQGQVNDTKVAQIGAAAQIRSLNVKNQIDFWTVFLPNMVRGTNYQIIIATHSLIPLLLPKFEFFKLIDVEPGYYEKSKKSIKTLIQIGEDVTSQMADQTKQAAPVEPTPPPTVTKPPRKKTPKKR